MKYVAKFVNGYHVSFNTETYENTQVFYLRKDAEEAVKKMNNNLRGGKSYAKDYSTKAHYSMGSRNRRKFG